MTVRLHLTDVIAGVTVLAWLIASLAVSDATAAYYAGFIPARVTGAFHLPQSLPTWLTPLSSTLVHGGLGHVAVNMVLLVYCGRIVERVLGASMLALIYAIGAYAAAAAMFLADMGSHTPVIGASGAISAIVGVYALLFSQQRVPKLGPIPPWLLRALWLGAAWTVLQWAAGFALASEGTQIATPALIGGFLAGLIVARPMLAWVYRKA